MTLPATFNSWDIKMSRVCIDVTETQIRVLILKRDKKKLKDPTVIEYKVLDAYLHIHGKPVD